MQNSAGAKAKQITNETTVSASEMGVDTFANCKVWLETTNSSERKTYATLAESVSKDALAIVGDTYYNNLETAINASSPENPAIMLKDVTVGSNHYNISKDNAVLETNGFTLDFNTVSSYIKLEFNQSFTIKGSGNKDKPDLVIGQLWVDSGYEEVDKNKGLFLYDVYLKNSHEWYDVLLYSPCHLYIENCKIDTVPKYGENKKKQNAIFIDNKGGEGIAEFHGKNILVGDIKVGVDATETGYESLEFVDGSLKKEIKSSLHLYGVENNTLSTIELPNNWEWVEPNKAIVVENWESITRINEQARFNIPDDQYDYSDNEGYDEDNNCINKQVQILVLKANEWLMYPSIEEWIYGEEPKTPTATAKYGTAKFVYCDKKDGTYTEEVPTKPATYYLKGIVEANDLFNGYSGLESDPIEFKILKKISSINFDEGVNFNKTYDGNQVTVSDELVNKTGSTGNVSFVFEKKEDDVWVSLSEAPSDAGTYRVKAILNEDDEYAIATSDPVEFTILKANSDITITSVLDKTYDGNKVSEPTYQTSGSDGLVSVKYQEYKDNKWNDLSKAPTNVGKYKVVVSLSGNDNYNPASTTLDFVISQTTNTWTEALSITGWTYNDKASVPAAKAQYGDVTFTYSSEENGTYTSEVPKNAGTYYVKASVAKTENYTGLEFVVLFTIEKANTTLTFEKDNIDKIYDKNAISEPTVIKNGSGNDIVLEWYVADGNGWQKLDNAPSDVGVYKVVTSVTEDTNYKGTSIEKEFSISMADNTWTKELSIKDWTYGETANAPSAAAKYGDVVYTYSNSKDGTYTSIVPTIAGTYYVKATVEGTLNYKGLVSEAVEFTVLKANTTLTITSSIDKAYDGNTVSDPKYKLEGNTNTVTIEWLNKDGAKLTDKPSDVGEYKVVVKVDEDTNYNSASDTKEFTISKADNTWTNKLSIKNWVYGESANTPTAKSKFGDVVFSYSDKKNGTYTSTVPTNAGTYYVKATVEGTSNYTGLTSDPVTFTIKKASSNVTITSNLDKTYDGNKVDEPTYQTSGSTGLVSINYQENKDNKWNDLTKAPTNVGKFRVVVKVDEDTNYSSALDTKEFTISKADNTWTNELTINGWVYGQTSNTPSASSTFGTAKYTYSESENGSYVDTVPTKAGTYYVKAEVEGTSNYKGLVSEAVEFTISKADPVLKSLSTLTIEQGKTLSNLGLPEGYKWKNPNYECKDLGTHTYKALFTPKDSVNYNTLDVDVSVNVVAKTEVNNPTPSVDSTVINNNHNNSYVGNGGSNTSSVLNELKEVVNKSEYKAYEKAYTKDSYDNYLNAFENAERVLNNKNSSKEEIKVALEKLNEAILNLKVDKTNLESSLVEFEKLDADKYSEASYIKLKDALDKAKSVMEDKEASAEEIARAIDELNEAYSSLQSAEAKTEAPKKSSIGKVALITTVTTVVVAGGGSYLWILLKKFRGMK